MSINEFIKKYQKKMWLSMISRLKLDINPWDIINMMEEPVYAGKEYIGNSRALVKTVCCLKCNTELILRHHKGSFFVLLCKCNKINKKGLTKKEHISRLTNILPYENAIILITEQIDKKTRNFPSKISYWLHNGYTTNEAIKKVKEHQISAAKDWVSYMKGRKDVSSRQIGYWLRLGLSEKEAYKKVKKIQTTNGLKYYIKKYGEKNGKILFQERINQWMDTLYSREDIIDINKRKGKTKEYHIEKIGLDAWIKKQKNKTDLMIQTMVDKGSWISRDQIEDRVIYMNKVSYYTRISLKYFHDIINPKNLKIGVREHHVDHIFSKNHGFLNNIDPIIIGCFSNLRVIPWKENISKGYRSDFTIKELMEKYEKSKNENGRIY